MEVLGLCATFERDTLLKETEGHSSVSLQPLPQQSFSGHRPSTAREQSVTYFGK